MNTENIYVIKHNGKKEQLDLSKATKSLEWATDGVDKVSLSDIEINSKLHFFNGIKTSYITDIFIKTCDDMTTLRTPNYDIVARNLKLQKLYKRVFKSIKPQDLTSFLKDRIIEKHYSEDLLSKKTLNNIDFEKLEEAIDHSRDFTFTSSGLDSLINGYSVCDMETPQFIYMAIAIDTFRDYHKDNTRFVIDYYNALSLFKITLPTPEMRALRTKSRSYASCIILRMGDSIDSWKATSNALIDHTIASAGVGIDISDVASLGDKVKKGIISHSGKIPVLKSIDSDIGKASQNGRRGSATAYVNFFDPEIEKIFALKSPRMPAQDRINDLSYGIKLNQLVYDRAKENKSISLFSTRIAPKLLDLFYSSDIESFIEHYEELESKKLYSSQIDARDFWTRLIATESTETSAYYIMNIDEANDNTVHTEPVTTANICAEYMSSIKPLQTYNQDNPDIGVCVLTNINQGIVSIEELPEVADLAVRAQSHIMQRQDHPTSQANAYVDQTHDIGIGLSNHAYWLAKQGLRYGQEKALYLHDEWMEHFSFNMHLVSVQLAKELGKAKAFKNHNKILPINRYKKTCDELVKRKHSCDWNTLKILIKKYGMYNVGLMMVPPSESSSVPSNQTSSIEPIKSLLTIKDKSGINYNQFAPEAIKLADKYDFAYDRDINEDFINHVAITQKWIDKGISANTFYNPEWNNSKILAKSIISDLFVAKHYGVKTRYYNNTKLPNEEDNNTTSCAGSGCEV